MKNIIKGFSVLLLLCLSLSLQAQDFKKDLLRMKESMEGLESCRSIVTTKIYQDAEPNKIAKQSKTEIIQKGWQTFSKSKEMDVLLNHQYILVHHREQALLSIQKHDMQESRLAKVGLEEIEKITAQTKSITYKGIFDNIKCYIIKPLNGPIELMELYLNASNGLPVKEVRHYYSELELDLVRSVMEYQFLDIGKTFSDRQFSEQQYVEVSKEGTVKLKRAYRDYQLIVGGGLTAKE